MLIIVLFIYGAKPAPIINLQIPHLGSSMMQEHHIKKENIRIELTTTDNSISFKIKIKPKTDYFFTTKQCKMDLSTPASFYNIYMEHCLNYALEYYTFMELRQHIILFTNKLQEIYCFTRVYEYYIAKKLGQSRKTHNGQLIFSKIQSNFHSLLSKRKIIINETVSKLLQKDNAKPQGQNNLNDNKYKTIKEKRLKILKKLCTELLNEGTQTYYKTLDDVGLEEYEINLLDTNCDKVIKMINDYENFANIYSQQNIDRICSDIKRRIDKRKIGKFKNLMNNILN